MADPSPSNLDPEIAERRQQLMDRLTEARSQGLSWDTIHESLNNRVAAARKAGVSDLAIQQSLGFNSPDELIAATQGAAQQNVSGSHPASWLEAFASGMTHSSTAALLGKTPDNASIEGRGHQIVASLGEAAADLPVSLAGALLGQSFGGLAGAVVGGGPEDLPAVGAGQAFGGMAGANALPQLIKSERDRYVSALNAGQVHNAHDFLNIQSQVLADTAKAALVGVATAGAGRAVAPILSKVGAGSVTKFVATAGAETATMATASSLLAGRMPSMEDFVDSAVTVGAFHVAGKITGSGTRAIRERIQQHYVNTGEMPEQAANRAINDPVFRAQMLGEPDSHVPPGSSRTDVEAIKLPKPGEVSGDHSPTPPDQYVIPRQVGNFDEAFAHLNGMGGGLTTETGKMAWSISAKAHPELFVDGHPPSKEDAAEVLHRDYWKAIDADALDPKLRLAAFDSAINEGVPQTQAWLKQAGGDFDKFMDLRLAKIIQLSRDAKYADQAPQWGARIRSMAPSAPQIGGGTWHGISETDAQNLIRNRESRGNYDVVHYGPNVETRLKPPTNPTKMTLGQVYEFQRQLLKVPGNDNSSAMGAYQFVGKTLKSIGQQMYGENWENVQFSKATQDAMFHHVHGQGPEAMHQAWGSPGGGPVAGRAISTEEAIGIAQSAGFRVTDGRRTIAQQQWDYDHLRKPGNPVAKPNANAPHVRGIALDIGFGKGVTPESITRAFEAKGVHLTKIISEAGHYHIEWGNARMDAIASIVENGPKHIGEDFAEHEKALLNLDEDGGSGKPPEPPEGGDGMGGMEEGGDPWEHVMGRVAPAVESDPFGKTIEGFKRIYGELFDPSHPVRALVDSVTKGEPLDDYRNPELLFRIAENSGEVAKWAISKQMVDLDGKVTGHSLEDIASGKSVGEKWSPSEQKRFLDGYAVAKWAMMMDEQGKKSGVDIDKAKAVVEQGQAKYGEAFQHLVDWRNGTLKWLGEGGVHANDKIDKLIAENTSTIPGYRRMDDGSYQPVSTGKPGIWNPIKTAKGSERKIEPILKSLMQDAFLRHSLAENNRAMQAIADLGLKGDETGPLASQKRAVSIDIMAAMDDLKKQGIDEDVLSGLAKAAGQSVAKDEVPVFRDGKLYAVKFDDPELTRVLRGYDQNARSTLMKVIGTITSMPRNLQTRFNPLFPLRLLTYDLPWQAIVNPDAKGPLSSFFLGLGHMTTDPEGYQAWLRSGAADHIFTTLSKDQYIQNVMKGHEELSLADNMWNAVKTPFGLMTSWTRLVGTPLRYGRYVQGLQKGETPIRAAVASTEAAFHRPGYGGPVGKAWNTLVPYTTAHLNGLEKSVRAQFGLGRTVTGVEYSALRTTVRGLSFITLPVIAQWFANRNEEWYKAMPEWQKNNAWFIVPPTNGSPPIPIAAPPILSTIYVALPRMLLEGFIADNPHAADDIWKTLGAGLLPPGGLTAASILTPIVEHIANFSFHRDRPLVSDDMIKGVQPAEQFTPYSSQASKDLAQFASDLPLVHANLGASPAVIDNYIAQWGGPMGRAAVAAADAAIARAPNTPRPETKVSEWPGISSWVARYPSASAAPIEQFYDGVTKLNQEHGSLLKDIRDNNFEAFKRIVDEGGPTAAAYHQMNLGQNAPPNVDLTPYYNYLAQASAKADYGNMSLVKQAADALKQARAYSASVSEDPQKTAHDKRQILDAIYAQMQMISERGNEAMDRALIGTKRAGASAKAAVPESIMFQQPEMAQ